MVSAWPEPASAMAAGSIAGVRDGVEAFVLGIIDTPPERGRSQFGSAHRHPLSALSLFSLGWQWGSAAAGIQADPVVLLVVRITLRKFERALAGLYCRLSNLPSSLV